MAVKTFYLKDAAAPGSSHGSLQEGGTVSTATMGTGWTVGKVAAGNYSYMDYGTEVSSAGFNTTVKPEASTPGTFTDWRSERTLSGTFTSGSWSLSVQVCGVGATGSQDGNLGVRIFKGAAADGSDAVEMTTARTETTIATNLGAAPGSTLTATVSVTANLTLTNEYLFVELAWEITGAGGSNNCDVLFRQNAAASFVTTTQFNPATDQKFDFVEFPSYIDAPGLKSLRSSLQIAYTEAPNPPDTPPATIDSIPSVNVPDLLARVVTTPSVQQSLAWLYLDFNPATINLEGWWREFGGMPWNGTSSLGSSGSANRRLVDVGASPTQGPALNQHGTASGNGTTTVTRPDVETALSNYITTTTFSGWALVFIRSAPNNANLHTNGAIVGANGSQAFAVTARDNGGVRTVSVVIQNAVAVDFPATASIKFHQWNLVQWRANGTVIEIRVNGENWVSATGATLWGVTPDLNVFHAFGNGDMLIAELALTKSFLSDGQSNDVLRYARARYNFEHVFNDISFFQSSVFRPTMLAAEQFVSGTQGETPTPPVVVDLSDTEYPDAIARLRPLPLGHFATSQKPERTAALATTQFPDGIDRPRFPAAHQLASFGRPIAPERTSALASIYHPERVLRPALLAAAQLAVTEVSPKPERAAPLAAEVHPDRVDRPWLPAASQLAVTELSPAPERTSPLAVEIHADRVDRPWFVTANQLAVTGIHPKPDLSLPLTDVEHPNRLDRPSTAAAIAPVFWLGPFPIAPAPTVPDSFDAEYPDSIDRPKFGTSSQQAFGSGFRVERTTAVAIVEHPNRIDRPWLLDDRQLAVTSLSPKPERAVDFYDARYPDRILRLYLDAPSQLAVTTVSPKPEQIAALADVEHPSRVERPWFAVDKQVASTTLSPKPERTSALVVEIHADRVDRPIFGAHLQLAITELSPKVDRTTALASVVFADRVDGARVLTALQPSFAPSNYPIVPPAPDLASTWWPDRIDRPWAGASTPAFWLWPFPIATQPAPNVADVEYPARVDRPRFAEATQQAFAAGFRPERTSALASTVFSDRVDRVLFRAGNHFQSTTQPPKPERKSALASTVFADRVDRIIFAAANHFQATSEPPKPERKAALAAEVHPDRITRPFYEARHQLAVPTFYPRPERKEALAAVSFVDYVNRATFGAYEQLAVAPLPAQPVNRTIEWAPAYPDRASRAWVLVADQPFITGVAPLVVDDRLRVDWTPLYPERVFRFTLDADNQQAFTHWNDKPFVPPAPELVCLVYPDRALRPTFGAELQVYASISTTAFLGTITPIPDGELSVAGLTPLGYVITFDNDATFKVDPS